MTGLEHYRNFTGKTLEDIGNPIKATKQNLSYWIKAHVSIPKRYRESIVEETGVPVELLEKSDIDELDRKRIEYFVIKKQNETIKQETGETDDALTQKLDDISKDIEVLKELDRIAELINGERADTKYPVLASDEIRSAYRNKMLRLYSKFTDLLCNNPDDSVFIEVVLNALEKINNPENIELDATEEDLYKLLMRMRKKRLKSYDQLIRMEKEMIEFIIENNL